MKKTLTIVALMLVASATAFAQSKVYLTREISPEALVNQGVGECDHFLRPLDFQ